MDVAGSTGEVVKRRAYLLIFVLSGFCGLIYESIWTHYLKLFLGHAAYAQTLVLAIFMGGMAVGSWLASRLTPRWSSPLLAYAAVEVLVGVFALVFHRVFVALTDWSYDTVIPALGGPLAIELWKWGLAALLILPQSILLGATFPFMSAGLARRFPRDPGRLIAGLYFANSLGAAAGILASGFLLIAWVGLPGTILTAGLLNVVVALLVYLMVRTESGVRSDTTIAAVRDTTHLPLGLPVGALLLVSALTGLASFVYEIGWIRMLSLVLGSSTHAFELMLSAFILGLAIGGFWVRRHVDHFREPVRTLAIIQVVMGVLAIGTLVAYQQTFHAMDFALQALQRTEQGYLLFNLASHGIALAVMLPATICAGMTLPIITWLLMTRGEGEAAIGRVYAANTVGAIAGVVLAVQWLMPAFGLKWLLIIGGVLDIALGVWLFRRAAPGSRAFAEWPLVAGGALAYVVAVAVFVPMHTASMASGVFQGRGFLGPRDQVIYHHDGKTATVNVVDHGDALSIRTNGKVDAGLKKDNATASEDESTMVLSAAIPVMIRSSIRSAAVIGLGSGMSTDTLLAFPGIDSVDTIEIEPGMVEGARLLGSKVARTFTDPRSTIHIADAKTFFTRQQRTFDLIISEPSNPWVSGVAGLFSVEFYRRVRKHLTADGLFAQWFNVYHADMPLVASVAGALQSVFPEYRVFATSSGDVLFVAATSQLPETSFEAIAGTGMEDSLRRVGIRSQVDLGWTEIGSAQLLGPLFASYAVPANSDYFPFLDLHAVRARYLGASARELQHLATMWPAFSTDSLRSARGPSRDHPLEVARHALIAQDLYQYWQALELELQVQQVQLPSRVVEDLLTVRTPLENPGSCGAMPAATIWLSALLELVRNMEPYLPESDLIEVLRPLRESACAEGAPQVVRDWLDFFILVARGENANAAALGARILREESEIKADSANAELVLRMLRVLVKLDRSDDALALWKSAGASSPYLEARALAAYAYANRADKLAQ